MAARSPEKPFPAAALVAVAVLLSMGSMADASAAAVASSRPIAFSADRGEREAVAHWLSCLQDAARRLQGQPAALTPPPDGFTRRGRVRVGGLPAEVSAPPVAPALDFRLIDLPPPARA